MRRFVLALVLALVIGAATVPVLHSLPPVRGAISPGVNLWRNYSDPASDVEQFYTSNGTPLVSGGQFVFSPNPASANLLSLSTWPGGTTSNACPTKGTPPTGWIAICIKLKGKVGTTANFTYTFDLYTDANDQVHYIVNYTGGTGATWLRSNKTSGFTPVDITGNASIEDSSGNANDELLVQLNPALIPSISAWNADAMAQDREAVYTYRDYLYQVPGHPGTAPAMISGHVYEAGTTTGIVGANVSTDVGGYYTSTNATGAYTLFLAPGIYNISASKSGYNTATVSHTVGTSQILTGVDIQLSPAGFLGALGSWTILAIVGGIIGVALLLLFLILRQRRRGEGSGSEDRSPRRPGLP